MTREYKKSTIKEVNGIPMLTDNSVSKTTVTDQDIDNIRNATIAVREKITK